MTAGVVVAAMVPATLTGCGSSSHGGGGSDANPSSPSHSAIASYLIGAGEEPGFPPNGKATNYTSAAHWAAFSQLPGGAGRLTGEGFVDAVIESLGDSNTGSGTSSVTEFRTAAGARAEVRAQVGALVADGATGRFSVPGVSSAAGVVIGSNGSVGTNVFWVEGRCAMSLGNSAATALRSQVAAGVRALYRRTHGTCP